MAEVLLFHHAQGLTPGVVAFADELRAAGHTVHTPDLFDGRTFGSIPEGMAFINETGFDNLGERGVHTADDLPAELVYAGFSFGVTIAQQLAQTRPGARGALLFYSAIPISGELQAQGDLIVVPLNELSDQVRVPATAKWREVPPEGVVSAEIRPGNRTQRKSTLPLIGSAASCL